MGSFMKKLKWTVDNISDLGKVFLQKILSNMRGYSDSRVRIGETGEGIQPNYQVTFPNKNVLTICGASHKKFSDVDKFKQTKISRSFDYAEIKVAYQRT
jgi:rRNA pseudouridine-1189 N-methylase Emg1 (Nep1/Mra1 family)